MEAWERPIICFILGLFGVMLFMIGGSLVIGDPVAMQLGLFLIGFGVLLIVWSGAGLSYNSQTVSTLRDKEQEEARGTVSVKAECPHCNAGYFYRLRKTESARTVTCQNCGRQFEVTV